MSTDPLPDGPRTNILVIPLPDTRPVVRETELRPVGPDTNVRETCSSVQTPRPVAPVGPSPAVPVPDDPTSGWTTEPDDDEDAVGEWYVVRPLTDTRPRPRTRADSPTGRVHLVIAAVAVPVAGGFGILVAVVDTVWDALAVLYPIATLTTAALAWLFLSRPGAWVRARIGAVVGVLRR